MQEILTAPTSEVQETRRPGEQTVTHDQLAGSLFGVEVEKKEPEQQQPVVVEATQVVTTETKPEEIKPIESAPVVNSWYKDIGWESEEAAKNEILELKKLKEQKPEEIKFENDQSKHVHELIRSGKIDEVVDFYSKQKAIDKVVSSEVNKQTAAEIIKLNLQLKYPTLTKDQIDFQYRQEYSVPREPVYNEAKETEDEFKERHDSWLEQVSNIEMKAVIAATMAKPELEQQKAKIVLPDISHSQVHPKQLTQEELDAQRRYEESYLQSVDASLKDFSGFSVKVKSEAAGLPETAVTYGVIDAEKNSLGQLLKDFAKVNYDANSLFAQRWVGEGGVLNTKQMIEDRYLLDNRDKIFQKIADDTATKVFEAYIKGKKNIDVTQTQQGGIVTELNKPEGGVDGFDTIRDNIFGKTG